MAGTLMPGDRLPTVRQLAGDLGIANNTVGRAYKELEQRGLVTAERRRGTIVVDLSNEQREVMVRSEITGFVERLAALGLPLEQLKNLVASELDKLTA